MESFGRRTDTLGDETGKEERKVEGQMKICSFSMCAEAWYGADISGKSYIKTGQGLSYLQCTY